MEDSPEEVGEEQDPEEVGERFIELLRNLEDEDLPDGPISEEEKKEEQVSPKQKRLKKSSKNKGSIFFFHTQCFQIPHTSCLQMGRHRQRHLFL